MTTNCTNCPHCPAHLDRVTTQSGPTLHCPSCGHVEAIRNKPAGCYSETV